MSDQKLGNHSSSKTDTAQAIEYSRILLESVLDTVGEAIIAVDGEGTILRTNQATADMWGYPVDVLEGMNLVELMPEKFREAHQNGMKRYLQGGQATVLNTRIELEGLHAKDGIFPLEIIIKENSFGDQKIFTAAVRDITNRKNSDRLLLRAHRLQVVEQLSGGIAHEFNNLLSIIKGNLVYLKQDLGEEAASEVSLSLEDALSATEDSAELTARLMAFSRSDFLEPKMHRINQLIEESLVFLAKKVENSIRLVPEYDSEELCIDIDSRQFENALVNLVLNAIEAMPEGGDVIVKAERYQHGDPKEIGFFGDDVLTKGRDYIRVSVSDSGVGIADTQLSRVFEPFFTTKDIGRGSGVGLSMVYGFARQSKGHCFIRSRLGVGTTVAMCFPEAWVPEDAKKGKRSSSRIDV